MQFKYLFIHSLSNFSTIKPLWAINEISFLTILKIRWFFLLVRKYVCFFFEKNGNRQTCKVLGGNLIYGPKKLDSVKMRQGIYKKVFKLHSSQRKWKKNVYLHLEKMYSFDNSQINRFSLLVIKSVYFRISGKQTKKRRLLICTFFTALTTMKIFFSFFYDDSKDHSLQIPSFKFLIEFFIFLKSCQKKMYLEIPHTKTERKKWSFVFIVWSHFPAHPSSICGHNILVALFQTLKIFQNLRPFTT